MNENKKTKASKAKKMKLVNAKYNIEKKETVDLDIINYRAKIYLLAIFRVLTDECFDKILPLNNSSTLKTLSPSQEMDLNILDCLHTSEIILVNPKSNIDSFKFNNQKCTGFEASEVSWVVNISSKNKTKLTMSACYRLVYEDLIKYVPTSHQCKRQIYSFTVNLAINEVIAYLKFKSEELNYELQVGTKTTLYIEQLLGFLSVAEIYEIIDEAVDHGYLLISRTSSPSHFFGKTISNKIIELGEIANRKGSSLSKSSRKECLAQSEISKVFYELIHGGSDEGFYECPTGYWEKSLESCYSAD